MSELSDDELLAELGIELEAKQTRTYTAEEERVIAGFEDITRFFDQHGCAPSHADQNKGVGKDIFERLYAVRLDRLRESERWCVFLKPFDKHHLLDEAAHPVVEVMSLDDDALLSELGVDSPAEDSIENLRHVRKASKKTQPEDIANRKVAHDFKDFKPLFEVVQKDLKNGARQYRAFVKDVGFSKADIQKGHFFVLDGLMAYVAEVGDPIKAPNGDTDSRLRVIFSNGTESNMLLRSLQRALYKDENGRRISELEAGPLFSNEIVDEKTEGQETGTIYILRSNCQDPWIIKNRDLFHKIGVTSQSVAKRIANAKNDPTFLMDSVEVVSEYKLYNINFTKLENLLHKFFYKAQLDIVITDRLNKPIKPKEWFLVPLDIIDQAIEKVKNGTLHEYRYDPQNVLIQPI